MSVSTGRGVSAVERARVALVGHIAAGGDVLEALGVPDAEAAARRLWPDVAPASAALPLVVHRVIATDEHKPIRTSAIGSGAPLGSRRDWPAWMVIQIDAAAGTPEEAARVADAVRRRLVGGGGAGGSVPHGELFRPSGQQVSTSGDTWARVLGVTVEDERSGAEGFGPGAIGGDGAGRVDGAGGVFVVSVDVRIVFIVDQTPYLLVVDADINLDTGFVTVRFDRELSGSGTDAVLGQWSIPELAPSAIHPAEYVSLFGSTLVMRFDLPVFIPLDLSLAYAVGGAGHGDVRAQVAGTIVLAAGSWPLVRVD